MELDNRFFTAPVLNSPYKYPDRHWELDPDGQPTQKIIELRRSADFITPIPKPKSRKPSSTQQHMVFDEGQDLSSEQQQYARDNINQIRAEVDRWRALPNPNTWLVTPETARLLEYWRGDHFTSIRPFFCQVEAVETAIWLTEVAPKWPGEGGRRALNYLAESNANSGSDLPRLALKLATGTGKTTIMAMLIAWQTINAVRHPNSSNFTAGFLVVAPGITIRDRLRVLQPNDPYSYYSTRDLVPKDMLAEMEKARVVITNYHAFKLRDKLDLSRGGRSLLQGRGQALNTLESDGQMMQRVMPELMAFKNIIVFNDEAHHCYRDRPPEQDEVALKGEDRREAEKNNEEARLWITGLEAINKRIGVKRVIDLSATPFFLRGSGYAEGVLFPWTMSDFSLMDAIECGIVKLPRVPISDNIPGSEMPRFRNLWEHIRADMPRRVGRGKVLDPQGLPTQLQTALDALYGHYKKTFDLWQQEQIPVPPCLIVVCQNTTTSKLVYDFIAGYERRLEDGSTQLQAGRFDLFRNYDGYGNALARPRTLLIDSKQLESGEALDRQFRTMAADEIERFRREIIQRTRDPESASKLTDENLLREVMNTVGKEGTLGESVRCVVSVSMLSEGWDANTVTHVLGVRAFGTQLLCEQVIGRSLRRQSYDLNEEGLFDVEYADILGIPFDFTARPVIANPTKPKHTYQVKAISPDRDHLEIQFPRVSGYRVELAEERLVANFNQDSKLVLTPELVGPSTTQVSGIIGEAVSLDLQHLEDTRKSTILYVLTHHLLTSKWRDANEDPKLHLFGQLKRITRDWLDNHLECEGGTYPAQLVYRDLTERATERIMAAITSSMIGSNPVKALLDPFDQTGSTRYVNFTTSEQSRWDTGKNNPVKSHVNWLICDSDWEAELCRVVEQHPKVTAYVKNHNLGLDIPYRHGSRNRIYIPDFIVQVDDGRDDRLNLVVEIKGYRGEDAIEKKNTMDAYWIPGVNNLKIYGRWAFAEFTDVYKVESEFKSLIDSFLTAPISAAD